MTLIREDQFSVTATLTVPSGVIDLGIFDKMTGGEVDSESSTHRPGAMGKPIALGGPTTYNAVVVSRGYDLQRDHAIVPNLLAAVGVGEVVVVKQPLDRNKVSFGTPTTYKGTLKQCTLPDHDSNGNNAATVELEIDVTDVI